jgi:hypothetical protein
MTLQAKLDASLATADRVADQLSALSRSLAPSRRAGAISGGG